MNAKGSKIVLWRHPALGMVADVAGREREWGLTETRAVEIVREWASAPPPERKSARKQ